jgi:hypothetical protein
MLASEAVSEPAKEKAMAISQAAITGNYPEDWLKQAPQRR